MRRLVSRALLLFALAVGAGCGGEPAASADGPDVRLGADGSVLVQGPRFGSLRLSLAGDAAAQDAALVRLGEVFRKAATAAPRDERGHSTLPLRLEAEADARWLHAIWVLQAAARPEAWLWDVRLRVRGEDAWHPMPLPRDAGLTDAGPIFGDVMLPESLLATVARVDLHASEEGSVRTAAVVWFVEEDAEDEPRRLPMPAAGDEAGEATFVRALADAIGKAPDYVELGCARSSAARVRFGSVLQVHRLLRRAWQGPILLTGAPPPASVGR